jgi:hypothetical protein
MAQRERARPSTLQSFFLFIKRPEYIWPHTQQLQKKLGQQTKNNPWSWIKKKKKLQPQRLNGNYIIKKIWKITKSSSIISCVVFFFLKSMGVIALYNKVWKNYFNLKFVFNHLVNEGQNLHFTLIIIHTKIHD